MRTNFPQLQLFPAKTPLEPVSIDILGEFIRTRKSSIYLLVITDRFTTMGKEILLKAIYDAEVARKFVHHWMFNYRPQIGLFAD